MKSIPAGLARLIEKVNVAFPEDEHLQQLFQQTFLNTYETTLQPGEDGKTFVITGDILQRKLGRICWLLMIQK